MYYHLRTRILTDLICLNSSNTFGRTSSRTLPLSMEDHSRIRVGSGTPARASLADPPTVGCNMQLPSADMQLRSASWDSWNAAGIQRHSAANQRNPAVICCTALNMATAFWRRYYGEEWGRKRRRRR